MGLLSRSNPWIKEWSCERKECLPCKSRYMISCEETERPPPSPGDPPLPRPSKDQIKASPKCTSEGIGYIIECWPCRLEGKTFSYVGESSRSSYQRGREHTQEVEMRRQTHPLVIHSEEQHEGRGVEIIMRVVTQTETALQRQVWESVQIDAMSSKDPKGCLNLKNEWGHSKNPSLEAKVRTAKVQPPESKGKRGKETRIGEENSMRDPRTKRRRSKSPVPRNTGPPEGTEARQTTASGANTPVSVKVKRLEAEIVKKARSMIVPKTSTRMIQPPWLPS